MAPLSLKIVLDEGAVTKTLMFDTSMKVEFAHQIVRDKISTIDHNRAYGFFLTSADDELSGVWLESDKKLEYYMLRDGDSLYYLPKMRNLRLRMLDGSVKTIQVDESKCIGDLMTHVCDRIGIPNNEEYGFCREECDSPDESKPMTGTLTLKKKTIQREKDALLEQLSKKLKTDDNVEWLDQHKTLRECRVDPNETLLFKRRLFYSDRNVDARDPVQLNLLYVQTRDAILDGRQVVTEDKAVEFAGIQCQVQYGDFQEDKHKPGFIKNLREFLPDQYAGSWGIEKKIIKEHRKHHGVSHLDAKHLYTKTARELPTYGVTFFLVKEKQKGKKKLIPRLLGINSESILRLDEETKEILQVWHLTQVKSYRAGSEFFTLNFGDYSDKEYSVKTNEAFRIRDILQGYIDIIRKRQAAPYNVHYNEGEVICEEMVESSRGTYTQNVVATKPVITTFVGPSQIISAEQGHKYGEGTTIVTAHKVITTTRGEWTQRPMRKEWNQSGNAPQDLGKKLNRLNSEAVRTVVLLSDPTQENLQEVCKIIDGFEDGLPSILKGVNETAANLKEDESKKLLEELDELSNYINILASTKKSDLGNQDNLMTAQDSAKKIADLSTQMFFSLDPKTKRRSHLLRRSRNSFILDEKTEASLRRASFITATENACQAVENAKAEVDEDYNKPPLSDEELRKLECETIDRIGKLNAAIALLLNAHADPNNIDYEMAVNSMKTINELMPDFIKDAKPLICTGDENANKKLRHQVIQLLDGARNMCMLTGSNDVNKMYDEGNSYGDVANKLIFTFKRSDREKPSNDDSNPDNNIMALAKVVGEKVSLLLKEANELNDLECNDPRSENVDAAGAKCADTTQGLLACAKLAAQSIHEPHCQSALTAAAENLSSSIKNLALAYKPLVDKPGRHGFSKQLADRVFDLAKALDKLKDSYSHLNVSVESNDVPAEEESDLQRKERLKFVMSSRAAKNGLKDAEKELQDVLQTFTEPSTQQASRNPEARRLLSQRLAQLNAAIASLIQATSDTKNPDYDTAGTAVNTISQLTPTIINDAKGLRGNVDENAWQEIAQSLNEMLEATKGICESAENGNIDELNKVASKIASPSRKLTFKISPRRNAKTENEILELSKSAVDQTAQHLTHVNELAKKIGGEEGSKLDDAGVKAVDAAQQLLKTAEITAPSIEDTRCQSALLSAIDRLSDRARNVQQIWEPIVEIPEHRPHKEQLNHSHKQLNSTLEKLKQSCVAKEDGEPEEQQKDRHNFVVTTAAAKDDLNKADKHLQELINTAHKTKTASKNPDAQRLLSQRLAQLNTAIASLALATSDTDSPDYKTAGAAVKNICQLTPTIINDTKEIKGNVDENAWKEITESLKEILEATRGICGNGDCSIEELNDAASKIGKSSGKLTFIISPRRNVKKQNEVKQLSESAVDQMAQLLAHVDELAKKIGGEEGSKLDDAEVKAVDAAQQLLKTAEITAPSIEDARCHSALLSAIDRLSDRAKQVEQTWKPIIEKPEYRPHRVQLNNCLQQLNSTLDKLKQTCQSKGAEESEQQKIARHNFIVASTAAKTDLQNADKDLRELMKTGSSAKPAGRNSDARRLLYQKLAQLNAAIASLAQATFDADTPDYNTAGAAVKNICQLTPKIINDTKALQGNVDGNSWKEITDSLKEILEATREICGSAEDSNIEELNEAASKIATASGKLTFIINPRRNMKKQAEVEQLSKSATDQTAQHLAHVDELAKKIGGEDGSKLDDAGVKAVDAAQQLLKTAEITAPSIEDKHCQSALLYAVYKLGDSAKTVEQIWKPIVEKPEHRQTGEELKHSFKQWNSTLDKLKELCQPEDDKLDVGIPGTETGEDLERRRIQFVNNLKGVKDTMADAAKEIKVTNQDSNKLQKNKNPVSKSLLAQKLANLNAAIANMLQAISDRENKNYEKAEEAINTISALTTDIIKDAKTLQGNVDDKSWKLIMDDLKNIVDKTSDICEKADNQEEVEKSALELANSVNKMTNVINPRNNVKKENKILGLSREAAEQVSLLLSSVYQLAEEIDGDVGEKLDNVGVKVVDSVQTMLKTAEITSPTINNVECQRALLSSVDQVSGLTDELKTIWNQHVQTPKYRQIGHQLEENHKIVETMLDKLKSDVQEPDEEPKPHLLNDLSDAKKKIKDAEKLFSEDKMYDQRALPTKNKNTDKGDKTVLQKRLQLSDKLAQLNEAVALLLQAMSDRMNPDYKTAEKTISIISNLTPEIVQETIEIHDNMDDNAREVLFKEAKGLCNASQEICTSVENNDLEELNKAATNYAQSSGKLRFIVSPRSYPNKEKKILDLTRSICERTSLMLSRVSRLACNIDGDEGNDLNESGAKVADTAQVLLCTAQITASSITDRNCQSALTSSADTLSDAAQDLGKVWRPLVQDTKNKQIGDQLMRDLDLLNNELEVLKKTSQDNSDLNDTVDMTQQHRTISKPKEEAGPKTDGNMQNIDLLLEDIYNTSKNVEKPAKPIVIEDTPLRQLASKIMESAKIKAECDHYSESERKRFAELANKLADAINTLDVTNSRCRDTPFGSKEKTERALQLENAILNLQLLCIQSRQKDGEASNIVDLTEFVDDVTSAVDDLQKTTKEIKDKSKKEAVLDITDNCQKMKEKANELLDAQNTQADGNMFDDVLRIDQFAKDCDDNVQAINNMVRNIGDEAARKNLLNKLLSLEEKCNLLRFAAKSSISNAESATLEESLRNLEDTERKIQMIIKPAEESTELQNVKGVNKRSIEASQATLGTVIAAGNENKLPKALARYAVEMTSLNRANDRKNKLKEHLDRLLDILKLQIAVKNRRVVTWQDMNHEEVYTTTEKVLEELDSFANDMDVNHSAKEIASSEEVEILKEVDIKTLLAPNTSKVLGEQKELKIKLNQQIQKLNSMTGTIVLSLNKPESLARSLHTTLETAAQLSAIARGLKNEDPVQNKRIDEAAQEINVATYQLMKTAKSVSKTPTHPESRRRLLEACNLLNDSLNNIARVAIPADKMQRDCNELMSSLQLHQSFLTSDHPSCALSYPDCLAALQTQQDVISKLKSEQSMSRTECGTALRYVSSAISNTAEYAAQSAYLLTLSKEDQNAAKSGLVDVPFVKKLTDLINDTCIQIIFNGSDKEAKDQVTLNKQVQQLQEAINIASTNMRVEDQNKLMEHSRELHEALKSLNDILSQSLIEEEKSTARTMKVIDAVNNINDTIDNTPEPKTEKDPKALAGSKEVLDNTRNLLNKTSMMIRKASLWREEVMTWVTFGSSDVIKAFESLVTCIREKGAEAGLIEAIQTSEEPDAPAKSYMQTQLESALSWLRRPASKDNVKAEGVKGAENVVNMAEQMCEDLQGSEKEEMKQVIDETKKLLKDCSVKYNSDKAGLLTERLKELRKMLERGVVTRVVEDFLDEEPLADFENIIHKENDEKKRKFLLEKKLAELQAQLGRIKKTARFVADTGKASRQELMKTSDQVELLAPSLVKAVQQRIKDPEDQAAIEHYQKLLAEYAESLSRIRELCDKAVDPIEFSQAAGETMQRIKEESTNNPTYSTRSPRVIIKLYKRVVDVGINSDLVQKDPELKKTLTEIKSTVEEKEWEAKRADSWKDITSEILRRTGQVESALGGENIFLKQPEPDQPIFAAAHDLHSAVRGWAARDNEIVAVAKRTAVLMARLSDYMNTGNKSELIFTSNLIVTASREVAELAKKLALECSDIRIRTNLLQVCDRIPTISGQLKMLTTVKSSSLGHQGSAEDQEAMNMLVGNAQNLMKSIQEVVKAAAGASVKIMSQRGCRLKWVQRTYY